MTINKSNFFQKLAEATKPRLIERALNQPMQSGPKKLLTRDEIFWLNSALFSQFHALSSDKSAKDVMTLTKKLGNILNEEELSNLSSEFRDDLGV